MAIDDISVTNNECLYVDFRIRVRVREWGSNNKKYFIHIYFNKEVFVEVLWNIVKFCKDVCDVFADVSKYREDDVNTLRLNKTVLLPKVFPLCVSHPLGVSIPKLTTWPS